MMSPLASAMLLLSALLVAHLLLSLTLWKGMRLKARLPSIGMIAFVLFIAAWPLATIYFGLREGGITSLGHGHGTIFHRAISPGRYWFNLAVLFAMGAPLLSFALRAVQVLVTNWGETPPRLPYAGVSTRELREREPPLLQEQGQAIDAALKRKATREEIVAEAMALQSALSRSEFDRRERLQTDLRRLKLVLAVLAAGIAIIVATILALPRP